MDFSSKNLASGDSRKMRLAKKFITDLGLPGRRSTGVHRHPKTVYKILYVAMYIFLEKGNSA